MAQELKSWDGLSELEQLAILYSDAHKDAFGFRPVDGGIYNPVTVDDYNEALEKLQIRIEEQIDAERVLCLKIQREYETAIEGLVSSGAPDRASAVRWFFQANAPDHVGYYVETWHKQEAETVLWGLGFPIPIWEFIIPELIPAYDESV